MLSVTVWLVVAAHLVAPWALLGAVIVGREPEPAVQPMLVRALTTISWALTYSQVGLLSLWLTLGRRWRRLLVAPIGLFCLNIEVIIRVWLERQSKFTFSRYDLPTLGSELSSNFWRFGAEGVTWAAPLLVAFLFVRATGRRIVVARDLDPGIRPFQFRLMTLFGVTAAVAIAITLVKFFWNALPFSTTNAILAMLYPGCLAIVTVVAALGRQQLWWRASLVVAALMWMPLASTLLDWRGDNEYFFTCVATIQIMTLSSFRLVGYRLAPRPIPPPSHPV